MGGVLVAWKGAPEAEELRRGEAAGRIAGLAMREPEPYGLPGTDVKRTLVVFVKVAEPRISLPRRPGLARSRPLA
jgi:16S rRNA (guanine527-N7)-methyltransferase